MRCLHPIFARTSVHSSIEYLDEIYKRNETTDENLTLFTEFIEKLKPIATSPLIGSSIMSAAIAISAVLIYFLSDSELAVLLPMYLPGTSLGTHTGYAINVSYQMFSIYTAILTYTFHDVLLMFQLFHVILLTNIMRSKIRAVSRMAAKEQINIDLNMRNVILIHVDILR